MLEIMGIATLGMLWAFIAIYIGIGVCRALGKQEELPLAKFPVLFVWRLSPHHDLREVVIVVNDEIVWRGMAEQTKVPLPLGRSEVMFFYIDKDDTMIKETVDCVLNSDGSFQYCTLNYEQYPVRAAV